MALMPFERFPLALIGRRLHIREEAAVSVVGISCPKRSTGSSETMSA
jgi:hypothetical protein